MTMFWLFVAKYPRLSQPIQAKHGDFLFTSSFLPYLCHQKTIQQQSKDEDKEESG
jgi:hypothetical protein